MFPELVEKHVALRVDGLFNTSRGQKIMNALLASSAELFQTKRGYLAVVVKKETWAKIMPQLNIKTIEIEDGLLEIAQE